MTHSLQTSENADAEVSRVTAAGAGSRPRRSALRPVVAYAALAVVWIGLSMILSVDLVLLLLIGAGLLVLFQLARRQPPRTLWARDTTSFAGGWAGKALAVAVLILIPMVMLLQSLRLDRYANDSWRSLVIAAVLASCYVISRRLLLTIAVAALAILATSWMLTPNLATEGSGDPTVLANLKRQREIGKLAGSTTSPLPRSIWRRRIGCDWRVSVRRPRLRWRSGR